MTCWRTRDRSAPELDEHLGGDALALADEAEEDVLGADVVVAELQRLAQRQLEHLLGARRERDVAAGRRAALADDLLDLAADGLERDAERLERLGGDALALVDQPEQYEPNQVRRQQCRGDAMQEAGLRGQIAATERAAGTPTPTDWQKCASSGPSVP